MLYRIDDPSRAAGSASTTVVKTADSEVKLDFEGDTSVRYHAELTSLPVAPFPVYLEGDEQGKEILKKTLDPLLGVELTDVAEGTRYVLAAEGGEFWLKLRETNLKIQGAEGYSEESAKAIFPILKQVALWERSLALQNHRTPVLSHM